MVNLNRFSMDFNQLKTLLNDKQVPVTYEWLTEMRQRYPYFTLPALLYLERNGMQGNEQLLDDLAIATADRKALSLVLGDEALRFADFYPPETPLPELDTDATIDKFLNSYGNNSDKEIEAISNAIFNPTPDYADILAAHENELPNEQHDALTKEDELINSFIEQSKQKELESSPIVSPSHVEEQEKAEIAQAPISESDNYNDSMLSESLAKMYIARHKYAKALEIIENINLNFPEKSRFLRKLVTYQQFNKH